MPSTIDMAARFSSVIAAQHEILSSASDFDAVLNVSVRKTRELTRAAGAAVALREGERLIVRGAAGIGSNRIGTDIADDLHRDAMIMRSIIRSDEADLEARLAPSFCAGTSIRSAIVAPLGERGEVFGTVEAYGERRNAFDDFDSYTVDLLAGMISGSLRLARELFERQRSEERYRLLFEKNIAGVFRTSIDGRILDCNNAFADYLGYDSRDELLSLAAWDLYAARSDREVFLARLDREHVLTNLKLTLKKKDGTPMAGVVNVSFIPAADGETQLLGTLVEA